jgi:O-methyltransferase involved in polyketide biosynthesis
MSNQRTVAPDSTAVRVALWRALHLELDLAPHVIEDEIGLALAAPEEGWRKRPDMDPERTRLFRPGIVARARFIEDLVEEEAKKSVEQYVILGAGLDTFAQRRPQVASRLKVFEVDRPGPQAWKKKRLVELGYGIPDYLKFVPVDFETGKACDRASGSTIGEGMVVTKPGYPRSGSAQKWLKRESAETKAGGGNQIEELVAAGFDKGCPAVVASTGVSMYLTGEANRATLRQVAEFAPGSTFAMTYILPMDLADPEERPGREAAEKGARASGTPFISFYTAPEMADLAREAGFKEARCVRAADLAKRYFSGRKDGLKPSKSEEILVATT